MKLSGRRAAEPWRTSGGKQSSENGHRKKLFRCPAPISFGKRLVAAKSVVFASKSVVFASKSVVFASKSVVFASKSVVFASKSGWGHAGIVFFVVEGYD